MTFYAPRNIGPADQVLFDADGNAVGIQAAGSSSQPVLGFSPTKHAAINSLVSRAGNLATLTAPGLLSGVTYDSSNRAVQWTIDGVTYSANYSIAAINVAGSDGTITNISVDPAQRITAVATA